MATVKKVNNLVLNKVESREVYEYMLANNLVNDDELYFVEGDDFYSKVEIDDMFANHSIAFEDF